MLFGNYLLSIIVFTSRGCSQTTLTRFWILFDHLPPCVDIFYGTNFDKKMTFLDHLPTSSCKRSLWMTPNVDARMQGKRSVREPLSLQKTYIVDGAFLKSHLHFKCSVACSGRLIIVQYKGQMKPFCVP